MVDNRGIPLTWRRKSALDAVKRASTNARSSALTGLSASASRAIAARRGIGVAFPVETGRRGTAQTKNPRGNRGGVPAEGAAEETRFATDRLGGGIFVGREREIAELRAALEEAERGRGSLLLLSGDPGIGKTRLADRLCSLASERGSLVVWGRAWEGEGAPAFWPWVQVIRGLADAATASDLSARFFIRASPS